MFFYVSLVLVIIAAVTLVIGLLSSGLPLVIVSIVASFLAGVFLILTVLRDRPQAEAMAGAGAATAGEAAPEPAGSTAAAAPAAAVATGDRDATEEESLEDEEYFPIADYDDLRVSEIVPLLPELDDDELEMVREREEAGKARATVLGRVDELLEEPLEEEPLEDEEYFPIADYDDLRVSEIVPLLPELDDDELEMVREREEAGKARATVLGRVDELLGREPVAAAPAKSTAAKRSGSAKKSSAGSKRSGSTKKSGSSKRSGSAKKSAEFPIAGYDDLTVPDVSKRLEKLGAAELKQVRTYEKRKKNRKGVLNKIESELASR